MSFGDDFNGGPAHIGICPICREPNGTCYDSECEDCLEMLPRRCPVCGDHYPNDQFSSLGCCLVCIDEEEKENGKPGLEERIMFAMQAEAEKLNQPLLKLLKL